MLVRGPVYSTTFNPLTMVIVALFGFLLFGQEMLLGSVVVIFLGMYCFIWGKSKDINPLSNEQAGVANVSHSRIKEENK
ncbi:nodulin MtN21/EamA-like transporter family protein, putative [Medicago truncatula]|uniref:Nodulin MtN21/EamA-like transporter family protein, putative n=1 Tax=Medicago truncatula TaxID=3880 RepID=G7I352_MEDTR|nr:nodulin MtN21/EamA-like transporter family protein, putative [Medicago truncatula]